MTDEDLDRLEAACGGSAAATVTVTLLRRDVLELVREVRASRERLAVSRPTGRWRAFRAGLCAMTQRLDIAAAVDTRVPVQDPGR